MKKKIVVILMRMTAAPPIVPPIMALCRCPTSLVLDGDPVLVDLTLVFVPLPPVFVAGTGSPVDGTLIAGGISVDIVVEAIFASMINRGEKLSLETEVLSTLS
jgi:hypothetical protein